MRLVESDNFLARVLKRLFDSRLVYKRTPAPFKTALAAAPALSLGFDLPVHETECKRFV